MNVILSPSVSFLPARLLGLLLSILPGIVVIVLVVVLLGLFGNGKVLGARRTILVLGHTSQMVSWIIFASVLCLSVTSQHRNSTQAS